MAEQLGVRGGESGVEGQGGKEAGNYQTKWVLFVKQYTTVWLKGQLGIELGKRREEERDREERKKGGRKEERG